MNPRVAGTDTREAMATPTVRAAAAAAACAAGPGWAAAFAMPAAWRAHLSMPSSFAPWVAVLLAISGIASALLSWRRGPVRDQQKGRLPAGIGPLVLVAAVGLFTALKKDESLAAVLLLAVPVAAGWLVGQAARMAATACVPDIRPAASGAVVAGGLIGLVFAGHIALVAKGSGIVRAMVWSAVYVTLAVINMTRAHRSLDNDRVKIARVISSSAAAPPAAAVFSLEDITVSFGVNRVLHHASLSTVAGEVVALVGGNGAGKSTLLRVAAGLIAPQHGRVIVGRDEVTTLLPEERAASGLAFVSGARPVFPDLSVTENLRVAAFRSHLTTRSFEDATEAIFDLVPALAKRRRARAGVLSGGEQRLLAVAQTLYRRPIVLLADELSLGLDFEARIAVLDLLRVLADEGVTVVVVDHDLPMLLPRADRAALLSEGLVQSFDKPELLLTRRSDLLPATFLAGANG